ncbi:UNVERIFIED_CONTAM: hypothetical protein FKN15_007676 [Acipenser sinensis]
MFKSGTWGDKDCNVLYPFFCYDGFCVPTSNQIIKHVFVKTLKSWSAAQTYCRENHIDLATVHSQEEAKQLLNIAGASLISDAWIGLYRDDTQNWQWSNGYDVIYKSWMENLFCASINSVGQWEDTLCSEMKASMCYQGTPVPEDLHLISDSMVWLEAWQYCRDHYTDLVSLTSLAAQNRVSELVRNSTASRFWIGLHRTVVYDNWYWVAGKDKKGLLNYTNWAPGEPNNPYYEHCGEMVAKDHMDSWKYKITMHG